MGYAFLKSFKTKDNKEVKLIVIRNIKGSHSVILSLNKLERLLNKERRTIPVTGLRFNGYSRKQ